MIKVLILPVVLQKATNSFLLCLPVLINNVKLYWVLMISSAFDLINSN